MRIKTVSCWVVCLLISLMVIFPALTRAEELKEVDYKGQNKLYIKAGGAKITFRDDESGIFVSPEFKVRTSESSLYINSPRSTSFFNFFDENNYQIIIGVSDKWERVDIDVGGAQICGFIKGNKVLVDGGGVNITADIISDIIEINGGGVKITSILEARRLTLDGAGLKANLEVRGIERINMDGAGIKVRIKYLDFWEGKRYLRLNGVGGDLLVFVPENGDDNIIGKLDVDTNGIVDVDIEYYKK